MDGDASQAVESRRIEDVNRAIRIGNENGDCRAAGIGVFHRMKLRIGVAGENASEGRPECNEVVNPFRGARVYGRAVSETRGGDRLAAFEESKIDRSKRGAHRV
jgi:hypothetical protein